MKFFLLTVLLSIAACGDAEYTGSKERKEKAGQRDTVFDPMVGTMDRAKGVDDLSSNRMEQLNRDVGRSE